METPSALPSTQFVMGIRRNTMPTPSMGTAKVYSSSSRSYCGRLASGTRRPSVLLLSEQYRRYWIVSRPAKDVRRSTSV